MSPIRNSNNGRGIRTRITKIEASALFEAAGNKQYNFLDYLRTIAGERKAKKYYAAYLVGMEKLKIIMHRKRINKNKTSITCKS